MKKHEIIANLRSSLQAVMVERSAAVVNPKAAAARVALRRFQSARMMETHADVLAASETRAAAQFSWTIFTECTILRKEIRTSNALSQ